MRYTVIPDIHADLERLDWSIAQANGSKMIFLGDLIDAGKLVTKPDDLGVLQKVSQSSEDRLSILNELSPRETDVLKLIGHGCNNEMITQELHISLPTCKSHISSILSKLNQRDRTNLAILAIKNEILV